MYMLELHQDGHSPYVYRLRDAPVLIGRAPSNDLVVSDDQVSWHHAAVWLEGGVLYVRDMGSSNGTLLNGERIRGAQSLGIGDVVGLGPGTTLKASENGRESLLLARLLEDLDCGIKVPIRSDRFTIGTAVGSDLRLDSGPGRAATLLLDEIGEITLATEDSTLSLHRGQVFEVAGRRLRVMEVPPTQQAPTVEPESNPYPYYLSVSLNGPMGPEATLSDPKAGLEYKVEAENRAILLYMLARKRQDDLQGGTDAADAGWASDDEVSVGVWGKGGPSDTNNLHVLVYRLRKELQKAGFDPWFIEKRRKALRVKLHDVRVGDT